MTKALEEGEGSTSSPGRPLTPGNTRYALYRRLGGPQGRSGQVRKMSLPSGFDPRTVQPVARRYTDNATRPTILYRDSHLITRGRGAVPRVYDRETPVSREAWDDAWRSHASKVSGSNWSCARRRSDKAKSDSQRNGEDWECALARFQPLDYGPRGTAAVLVPGSAVM